MEVFRFIPDMPCRRCGRLLIVDPDDESSLFCPNCRDLPIESDSMIQAKTNWLLEDYFTDENILGIIEEYSKTHLILYLLTRLNHISNIFFEEEQTGIPIADFGYLTYIVKQLYLKDQAEFGDQNLDNPRELDEEIKILRDAYTKLILAFRDARNQFSVCIKRDDFTGEFENFASDYELYQSEYGLCFERCVKSIVCGDWETFDDYAYVADELRSVDKTDVDDITDSREFADAWYQYILQLRLIASSDDTVGDTYYTRLPDNVTIFDIEKFLERIDSQFSSEVHTRMQQESWVSVLEPHQVDQCGRKVFGRSWGDVKEHLIIREDNLDAHPFLFELQVTEERRLRGSRRPREIQTTRVFYPRFFAQIMKFQVFPLLRNGDEDSSHQLLSDLTAERGEVYERNLYDFLIEKGIECYHGAEITRAEPNEIDLLCVFEDSLRFIEVKYLMPPIRINGTEGIRVLNEKFDRFIFNEVSDESDREAEGKPYPEKVDAWTKLEAGSSFTSKTDPEDDTREEHVVSEEWAELAVEKFVVSNVVPSYIEKDSVRFLTDLEFYRWIEHEGEEVLYSLPYRARV